MTLLTTYAGPAAPTELSTLVRAVLGQRACSASTSCPEDCEHRLVVYGRLPEGVTRWEEKQVLGWVEETRATNVELTMQIDGLKSEMDARDERVLDLEAEVTRLHEAVGQARDLVAKAYDESEHDDSPGNMAFAVLNAALERGEQHGA
jgi:hypothetical protein